MPQSIDRREFLKLAGLGGVVFASGLAGGTELANAADSDFYFVPAEDPGARRCGSRGAGQA